MKNNEHPFLVSMNLLEKKVDQLIREFRIKQIRDPEFIILDNADFIQMFKISSKTAQSWRDEELIQYAQIKGKIYYKLKDIQDFLNRHKGKKNL